MKEKEWCQKSSNRNGTHLKLILANNINHEQKTNSVLKLVLTNANTQTTMISIQ